MSRLLPPPSLSLDLPIMEKPSSVSSSELTPTRLGFPTEFPYEFDSPAFSPGFTSPGDSTETEDESSDDEEDFLAGLTRRLAPSTHRLPLLSSNTKTEEKRKVAATSPQSTLSGLGSFSSNSGSRSPIFPQPQQLPKRDNAWDVISAAAGEVAKLKLGTHEPHLPLPRLNPNSNPSPLLRRQQNAAFQADLYLQQQRLIDQMWLCSQSRVHKPNHHVQNRVVSDVEKMRYLRQTALGNATWLPQQHAVPPPVKRASAGTGVFLPRRYPTPTPSDSLNKVTVNTTPILPSKVHSQNLYFDEPRISQFDYECMFARSTVVPRQRAVSGVGLNQERRLPQDWMY